MPSIAESLKNQSPLNEPLKDGLDSLSATQTVIFTQYVKLILPLDQYVFWVRSDLVSQVALLNAYHYNPVMPADGTSPPGATVTVKGSLHYASDSRMNEDESPTIHSVIFTSQSEIQDFKAVGNNVMYIGTFDGVRFAFTKRGSFYQQAGLHHYTGEALYPALASQIVDCLDCFDTANVVVSNSLPIWLTLNQFMPMYPSFLVQSNLVPPYASVHIPPDSTTPVGMQPLWDKRGNHSQLVRERVKITLYGMRNFSALDFQDYLFQYSLDNPTTIGFVGDMPIMRDEKRTQSELSIIAQKKVFECEISYFQQRLRDIARQLILKCIVNYTIGSY